MSPTFGEGPHSPASLSNNLFDTNNAAGLAAFAEQASRLGESHDDDPGQGPHSDNLFGNAGEGDDMHGGDGHDDSYGNMFNELTHDREEEDGERKD